MFKVPRYLRGQILLFVLLVIVVAAIVALAVSARLVKDIKQVGLERQSARAFSYAESAIDKVDFMIMDGQISGEQILDLEDLDICDDQTEDDCPTGQVSVEARSVVKQLTLNKDQVFEVDLRNPAGEPSGPENKFLLSAETCAGGEATTMWIRFLDETGGNMSVLAECIWDVDNNTYSCSDGANPGTIISTPNPPCGQQNDCENLHFDTLIIFQPNGTTYSYARIKPLLPDSCSQIRFSASHEQGLDFARGQYFVIKAGVYMGESGQAAGEGSQTYREYVRIRTENLFVPPVFDYVLFNGANSAVSK